MSNDSVSSLYRTSRSSLSMQRSRSDLFYDRYFVTDDSSFSGTNRRVRSYPAQIHNTDRLDGRSAEKHEQPGVFHPRLFVYYGPGSVFGATAFASVLNNATAPSPAFPLLSYAPAALVASTAIESFWAGK